jgi:hypothetical protein
MHTQARQRLEANVTTLEYDAVTATGAEERRNLLIRAILHLRRAERLGEPLLARRARSIAASCHDVAMRNAAAMAATPAWVR